MKRLYSFIDETGELGLKKNTSKLFGASFVFFTKTKKLKEETDKLNRQLEKLGFNDMLHTSLLVANRGEYRNMSSETRRKIFIALYSYIKRIDIKFFTIMINKKYVDNTNVFTNKLKKEFKDVLERNKDFFNKYDKKIVYYDGGQKDFKKILYDILNDSFNDYEMIKNFDKTKERLFQVTDFITLIDKLNYNYKKGIAFTNSEKLFFTDDEFKKIIKEINKKRL